jgi:hypothetical protein
LLGANDGPGDGFPDGSSEGVSEGSSEDPDDGPAEGPDDASIGTTAIRSRRVNARMTKTPMPQVITKDATTPK